MARCDVRREEDVVALFDGAASDVTDVVHAAGIASHALLADVSLVDLGSRSSIRTSPAAS